MTDTIDTGTTSSSGRRSPMVVLAIVGFSVFIAADDLTVVSTMLRPIIGDLGLVLPDGLDDAAWLVNAYIIAFVAVMPIAGRISDVIGRRRTFVGAFTLFLAGNVLIPLSVELDPAFGWFLTGRVMSAIGAGAMVPVALAVVGDAFPVGRRARALGTLGAIETLGWVWGPLYGAMLVRFLSWHWQFWLNVPVGIVGLALSWWALDGHDRPARRPRLDWVGAVLLTIAIVALNLALLGGAEIQSVSGLEELTGRGNDLRWLYPVALVAAVAFVIQQLRVADPLFDRRLFKGRNLRIALVVNFVVGAGLVIAMVDVPLFVNSVELDLERAAVYSGAILSALTAAMAVFSYAGGRITERWWYRPPVVGGLAMSTLAFAWMGATWTADTSYPVFAVQLGLLGAGFGLTVAPTTSAVVDAAPPDQRGAAAAIVMVVRLLGLSVGLSALTAWGLGRFDALRGTIELPPINDPGFQAALIAAQERLTAQAIAETFTAAGVVLGIGLLVSFAMRRRLDHTDATDATDHADHADHADTHAIDLEGIDMEPTPHAEEATSSVVETEDTVAATEVDVVTMMRRTNVLIGVLAVLLVGALGAIALMLGRVASATDDASAARDELAIVRADLERVEAGAALFASQITGFQELLSDLGPELSGGVDEAIRGLREFRDSTIEFTVEIDELIPIATEVVIDRTVEVPIRTSIPIQQSIDTTIRIQTPFGSIPVDVTVPVDVNVPIDIVVDIPIDETIPIEDEFAVDLDIPIAIEVGETQLADLTDSLALGLESLQQILTALGDPD